MQLSNAESVHTNSAQRQFERDVYDCARNMKVSMKDAKKQITRARHICSEVDHDSNEPALGNEVPNVTRSMAAFPAYSTTAHYQDPSIHGEASSSPQPHGADESRKRELIPEGREAYSPTSSKKKKGAQHEVDKQASRSCRHISNGAEEEGSKAGADLGKMSKRNKTGADSEVVGPKGFALDPSEDDAQPVSDSEINVASTAPLDNTAASNKPYIRLASALSDADRTKRKERKKQRRIAERLAHRSTRKDPQARKTTDLSKTDLSKTGDSVRIAPKSSGAIDSTEPKSQAEAHDNLVRANERDPNDRGPSTKKSNKDKRKSKQTTAALDAELRALNAFSNEQQIDNLDKGQLNEVSKAVKDDLKDAKAEQERIREDDKAGRRKVEESIRASAEKTRKKKRVTESSPEESGKRRKTSKKKHKSSESVFPHPNDSVGVTAADEGLSSTDVGDTTKKPPTTPSKLYPNIDIEFPWSDSPLSSAPSSPTPPSPLTTRNHLHPHHHHPHPTKPPPPPLKRRPSSKVSPYFPPAPRPPRTPRAPTSCIPFPPLSSPRFGLLQETLAQTPFHLLLACIFLTKTRGSVALPLFYTLITRYPTASALAVAEIADVIAVFQNLGLQNQRGRRVVALAKAWVGDEPRRGRRWRKGRGGRDVKAWEEPIADEEVDGRVAWEVGHLPGVGRYALDSWRIFCRDRLRGVESSMGEYVSPFSEAREVDEQRGVDKKPEAIPEQLPSTEPQPPTYTPSPTSPVSHSTPQQPQPSPQEPSGEWTHVLPTDKELRAYLRWRWLRHGWEWDAVTGERRRASEEVMREAEGGGVDVEGGG